MTVINFEQRKEELKSTPLETKMRRRFRLRQKKQEEERKRNNESIIARLKRSSLFF